MSFKLEVHKLFLQGIQDKIDAFSDMIMALTEDAKNDAKGSAGDKHETALSMMHIEQEKLNTKIQEYLAQKSILDAIDATQIHTKVALGSYVQTNHVKVYISTALPKINHNEHAIFGVSSQSPLALQLMGNHVDFEFEMNNVKYVIESVE